MRRGEPYRIVVVVHVNAHKFSYYSGNVVAGEEPAAAIQSSSISSAAFGGYCFLLSSAFIGLLSFFG